jgi:hypothetical protein
MGNTIANPGPVQIIGRASECLRRLMEAGLSYEALQVPIDDPEMRKRLVQFWLSAGHGPTTSQKRARKIMGQNFLGIEESVQCLDVKPTEDELRTFFKEVPFAEEVLKACKETHVLVADFGLSILEVRESAGSLFYLPPEGVWYDKEPFVREKGGMGWRLVRKDIVPGSTSRTWQEQLELLTEGEEVPKARVMVYTIILHYLATKGRLFEHIYSVRCQDVNSVGHRLSVYSHYFNDLGLFMECRLSDFCAQDNGLASVRKF